MASEDLTKPAQGHAETVEATEVGSGTPAGPDSAYEALVAEFNAYKRQVAEITGIYAVKHGWCGVADNALAELGLCRPQAGQRVTVNLQASWTVQKGEAPKGGAMWRGVEVLVNELRYASGSEQVLANNAGPSGRLAHLTIVSAEVSSVPVESAPDAHLLPEGTPLKCRNQCGSDARPGSVEVLCADCAQLF